MKDRAWGSRSCPTFFSRRSFMWYQHLTSRDGTEPQRWLSVQQLIVCVSFSLSVVRSSGGVLMGERIIRPSHTLSPPLRAFLWGCSYLTFLIWTHLWLANIILFIYSPNSRYCCSLCTYPTPFSFIFLACCAWDVLRKHTRTHVQALF